MTREGLAPKRHVVSAVCALQDFGFSLSLGARPSAALDHARAGGHGAADGRFRFAYPIGGAADVGSHGVATVLLYRTKNGHPSRPGE
jgi:hypothetical protein